MEAACTISQAASSLLACVNLYSQVNEAISHNCKLQCEVLPRSMPQLCTESMRKYGDRGDCSGQ
jgi:hypothetical protein